MSIMVINHVFHSRDFSRVDDIAPFRIARYVHGLRHKGGMKLFNYISEF